MIAHIETTFNCLPERAWEEVKKPEVLIRICRPVLYFKPRNGAVIPERWERNDSIDLKLHLFGFIPLGDHTITVKKIDDSKMEIQSEEYGVIAKVWNHFIKMEKTENGKTYYLDEIEIKSGILTPFVWIFANLFYRHRQHRWKKLILR